MLRDIHACDCAQHVNPIINWTFLYFIKECINIFLICVEYTEYRKKSSKSSLCIFSYTETYNNLILFMCVY